MLLTAFDEDADEHGNRDDLVATGTVEPSPAIRDSGLNQSADVRKVLIEKR